VYFPLKPASHYKEVLMSIYLNVELEVAFKEVGPAKEFFDSIPHPYDENFFRGEGEENIVGKRVFVRQVGDMSVSDYNQFVSWALNWIKQNKDQIEEAEIFDYEPFENGAFARGVRLGFRYFAGKLREIYTATDETYMDFEEALSDYGT
jgi:hypothetical protein